MKRTSKNPGTGKSRKKKSFREEFPGYPHYPVKEDIMNTNRKKLAIDLEKPEAPLRDTPPEIVTPETMLPEKGSDEDIVLAKGNAADVTKQEREALDDSHLDVNEEDDADLKAIADATGETDLVGSDLVVPGAELDDQEEDFGREDEENNLYSLGGDNHDRS